MNKLNKSFSSETAALEKLFCLFFCVKVKRVSRIYSVK